MRSADFVGLSKPQIVDCIDYKTELYKWDVN